MTCMNCGVFFFFSLQHKLLNVQHCLYHYVVQGRGGLLGFLRFILPLLMTCAMILSSLQAFCIEDS